VSVGRQQNERGASLVEFALVLPILVLLVFGVIEFGTTYNNYLSIRGGAREGARQADVGNFGTNQTCTGGAANTYGGGNTQTQELICLTKDRIGLDNSLVRVDVVVGGGSYAVGNPVVVCAAMPIQSLTGLFSPFLNNKYLKTKVQTRVENINASALASGHEDDPTGASPAWNWCSVTSS
jgi:Flp pilus assembly protein TadG